MNRVWDIDIRQKKESRRGGDVGGRVECGLWLVHFRYPIGLQWCWTFRSKRVGLCVGLSRWLCGAGVVVRYRPLLGPCCTRGTGGD
jgi:hypothetical protein